MTDSTKETDARILIDNWLRTAGCDPTDKSQVLTSVPMETQESYGEMSRRALVSEFVRSCIKEILLGMQIFMRRLKKNNEESDDCSNAKS